MSRIITEKNSLPAIISEDILERGGHEGDLTIIKSLTIETVVTGEITVQSSGSLTLHGIITGSIINHGKTTLHENSVLYGNLVNYGELIFKGKMIGETLTLESGSYTFITGIEKSIAFLKAKPNATVESTQNATFTTPN